MFGNFFLSLHLNEQNLTFYFPQWKEGQEKFTQIDEALTGDKTSYLIPTLSKHSQSTFRAGGRVCTIC